MKYVVMAKNQYGVASKTLMLVPGAAPDRQQADSYVEGMIRNTLYPIYLTQFPLDNGRKVGH